MAGEFRSAVGVHHARTMQSIRTLPCGPARPLNRVCMLFPLLCSRQGAQGLDL